MTDDDQLGVVAELVDKVQETVEIDVVERRLDLVHDIERRRPAAKDGEEEGERHERPFAEEAEPPRTPGEQHREEALEMPRDIGEGLGEDAHNLLVDGTDDPAELATGAAHVLELLGKEPVALFERGELLERQGVDRPHEA